MNQNNAGVYGTVVREGIISVIGQRVKLILGSGASGRPILTWIPTIY